MDIFGPSEFGLTNKTWWSFGVSDLKGFGIPWPVGIWIIKAVPIMLSKTAGWIGLKWYFTGHSAGLQSPAGEDKQVQSRKEERPKSKTDERSLNKGKQARQGSETVPSRLWGHETIRQRTVGGDLERWLGKAGTHQEQMGQEKKEKLESDRNRRLEQEPTIACLTKRCQ